MQKREFLSALDKSLAQLTEQERKKQLDYYDELLDDMIEDGMEETAAVEKLGDPSAIAQTIYQELPLPVLVKSRVRPGGGWTALSIILLVLGSPIWVPLALSLATVVLTVYLVIWTIIVTLFVVVLSIAVAGLALLIGSIGCIGTLSAPLILMAFAGGVILMAISLAACIGALYAAKGLVAVTVKFAKWVKSLFIKKESK